MEENPKIILVELMIYQIDKKIRINDFLIEHHYSKKLISAIKYLGGQILVNKQEQNVLYELQSGDVLEIILPREKISSQYPGMNKPIDIVYEDDEIIIILKPAHLETIPSRKNNIDTLANRLKYYYQENNIQANLHFISRLDKETSGLIMVAKNRFIHHLFSHYVEIEKKYLAIVLGKIEDQVIELPIKREQEHMIKRIVAFDGDYAKTSVKVVKKLHDKSLVECTLFTGRTHQIRVHLSAINRPIIGDTLYGDVYFHRLALHAYSLNFIHPFTNQEIKIKAALPDDLQYILNEEKSRLS